MQHRFILILVFFTGFAGLVYQVVWQKYVSYFLGSDALATSATLTSFFVCLALGYLGFGTWMKRSTAHRISIYCYLELAIGVYGAFSPTLFKALTAVYPVHQASYLSNLAFCFCFMGIPTLLMGGTIPALTEGLSRTFESSHRIHAYVYGSNTVGAFVGALTAGFYMIESLGLPVSLYVASVVNIVVFVMGRSVVRTLPVGPSVSDQVSPGTPPRSSPLTVSALALFAISFLSGFYTFSFENLLIRLAGISLGNSNYTYSIVVSAFIASVALGSYVASRFSNEQSPSTLLKSQLLATCGMILLYASIPRWPAWAYGIRAVFQPSLVSFPAFHFTSFVLFLALLAIPIGIIGMNLPLVFDSAKQRSIALGETVGKIYFVNCLGCAAGAAFGGNIFFQFWNSSEVYKVTTALLAITLPLCSLLLDNRKWRGAAIVGLGALLLLIWKLPDWPPQAFIPGRMAFPHPGNSVVSALDSLDAMIESRKTKVIYASSDPLADVHVEQSDNSRSLWINAHNNANTEFDATTRALAVLSPLTLIPRIESAFVIGLGAGLSTSILSGVPEVKKIQVAELSRAVIGALPFFSEQNTLLEKNWPKVTLTHGDAYQILRASQEKFDFVVAEPSHLWVPGVEKLYTQEFLSAVSSKLSPQGVHAQWFPLFFLPERAFLQILRTFQNVYPYVTLWHAPSPATLTILASHSPFQVQKNLLKDRFANLRHHLEAAHIGSPEALTLFQAAPEGLVKSLANLEDSALESEFPSLAFEAARGHYAGMSFDLNTFLEKHLASIDSMALEGYRLVRERSRVEIPAADFETFVGQKRKFILLDSSYHRAVWDAYLSAPQAFEKIVAPEAARLYNYLLARSDRSYNVSEKELVQATKRFRRGLLMLLNLDRQKMHQLFPTECTTDECTIAKVNYLRTGKSLPESALSFMSSQTPEKSRKHVDEIFRTAAPGR